MYKIIIKAIIASMNIFKRLNAEKYWKHELVVFIFKKKTSRVAIELQKLLIKQNKIICILFKK